MYINNRAYEYRSNPLSTNLDTFMSSQEMMASLATSHICKYPLHYE